MKRSPLQEAAKSALRSLDKNAVRRILDCVNLTPQEREAIERHELGGEDLESICQTFSAWGRSEKKRGRICSYSQIVRIKKSGMEKIGVFVFIQNANKTAIK